MFNQVHKQIKPLNDLLDREVEHELQALKSYNKKIKQMSKFKKEEFYNKKNRGEHYQVIKDLQEGLQMINEQIYLRNKKATQDKIKKMKLRAEKYQEKAKKPGDPTFKQRYKPKWLLQLHLKPEVSKGRDTSISFTKSRL